MAVNLFTVPKASDYLDEAVDTANYIDTKRVDTPHGLYWDINGSKMKDEPYYDEICLYAGSSGIAHYYLLLWYYTKDEKYLDDAKNAAKYIIYRWNNKRELAKNFCQWAFSTGYSGIASFLIELYEITGEKELVETVEEIVEAIIKDAKPDPSGEGYTFGTYPGIVGDAGIILFLLSAGKKLGKNQWVQFAIDAGQTFLSKARPYKDGGIYYLGVNPEYFHSDDNYIDPNFPMGAAGIGYTLLRIYEESKDERFLKAVDGIEEFHKAIALDVDGGILLPHGLPTKPDTYYLGYCHGPAGTARFYRKYYEVTKNEKYLEWEKKLALGIINTGAPEVHSNGYWNVHCYCCGTAGFTNLFLGIWAENNDEKYLEYAKRASRQILGFRTHIENIPKPQTFWYQAFASARPDKITVNLGMYDGAAGIGWSLLQMYGALTKDFYVQRAVDDPYPERPAFESSK